MRPGKRPNKIPQGEKKKSYRPASLINVAIKILNNILTN